MASKRRRSSIELEVQVTVPAVDPSVDAPQRSRPGSITGLADVGGVEQQLEAADGGAAAWKILCAAFMFEAVLFGFSVSFGVSQNYYTKLPEFKGNPYIPIVGTMASGIPYLGGPVMAVFVRRYQHYRLYIIWIGWPLCILGLIAGSFASSLGPLIFTQGIMYGGECKSLSHVVYLILTWALAGFVIFYYPISSIVNEWWIARRGMAFGVITSAAGASGIAMPLITEALLDRYGYRTTLRAIAVAMIVLTGPPIPPMRSRLPPSHASAVTRTAWSFASKSLFLVYCFANFTQGFGFFFPSLFLPSYANSIGLNARQGAMLLSLMRPHN